MEFHGNVTECGDVGVGPGRSFLFLLTAYDPGWINQRWGFMAGRATLLGCPVRLRRSLKIHRKDLLSCQVVLITAAGLQGEQPLVDRIM